MVSPRVLQTVPRLLNRYSIHENLGARLGRRTLLGYDHGQKDWVIIKYLCFDDPIQTHDIKRFCAEIAVIKSLDHPAIPAYQDNFEIHDHGYHGLMLVQEYIEGQSLYALISSEKVFTETELRDLACQILEILDYLHKQQPTIIHRDIKPSSFVLGSYLNQNPGQVYLVDFGLVQCSDNTENTRETTPDTPILISGTPGYRPPEQLGDRALPATDLYSLGATLVHLATGQHPNTLPQRGLRILFSQELGHISRPLKSWLRWLTQPKQHKRPRSAQAALQGLKQADKIFESPYSPTNLGHRLHRALAEAMAPANTQLKIFEYSQTLEVLFPPLGWKNKLFFQALFQIGVSAIGIGLVLQGMPHLWPKLSGFGPKLSAIVISLGWTYLHLRSGCKGLKAMATTLFQQVSIQLLPDIILLGYRFPHRPVDYQINTYKQDIEDIDLQPDTSTITVHLQHNRTITGELEHMLSSKALGVTPSEIRWVNDILQLWLKQRSSKLI